ncbi:MAG TPA: PD-(D/E)XK nuclease family protein [Anaerovoracaceae bacterium]|nr:PD-(D/E)XK nuclease family protein [Anaerovoracaceae bacterium]
MQIDHFQIFSQNKLQDYLDCQRRYELKHLLKQPWPAIQSEPVIENEEHMLLGQQFHLLVQQYFSGLEENLISSQINSIILQKWWQAFLKYSHGMRAIPHRAELQLNTQLNGIRLVGILDLVLAQPDHKFTIIDWKTNKNKPSRSFLKNHIQTRLYPLILTIAGKYLNNNINISPDQIEMIYWYPEFQQQPEIFVYSKEKYQNDRDYIKNLISEIQIKLPGTFQKTDQLRTCNFCNYRSLCNRGISAGILDGDGTIDWQEEIVDIDISQIGEIVF